MAGVLPAATLWSEGSRKSSLSIFIFPVARHRPLRSCGDFSPCSIVRLLPLEDLGTTSALPGRLVAGCVQAAIVLVMTPVVVLFIQVPDNASGASNPDRAFSVVSLLQLIYVVIAAGVALTTHRYVTSTSARIRRVSRLTSSSEPDRVAGTLAICFLIASFGCASVALQPPPAILMAMNWHLGAHAAGPMLCGPH